MPRLWRINQSDGKLFIIRDYDQPSKTLKWLESICYTERNGNGLSQPRKVGDGIQSLAIDKAARMYMVCNKTLGRHRGPVLLRLDLNRFEREDKKAARRVTDYKKRALAHVVASLPSRYPITGIAVEPNSGNLWIVNTRGDLFEIDRINGRLRKTRRIVQVDRRARLRISPTDLVFDKQGKLYVANLGRFLIQVDPSTGRIVKIAEGGENLRVEGMAYDHLNRRILGSEINGDQIVSVRLPEGLKKRHGRFKVPDARAIGFILNEGLTHTGGKVRIVRWTEQRSKQDRSCAP